MGCPLRQDEEEFVVGGGYGLRVTPPFHGALYGTPRVGGCFNLELQRHPS